MTTGIRTATRRLLSRRLSVADVIETALWLALPYVVAGLVWAFFNVGKVHHLETLLEAQFPAGGGMLAYLLVAVLWPVYIFVPSVCAA